MLWKLNLHVCFFPFYFLLYLVIIIAQYCNRFCITLITASPHFTSVVGFLKKPKQGAINYTDPTKLLLSVFISHLLVCTLYRVVSRKL
jgi:hypothetical protein